MKKDKLSKGIFTISLDVELAWGSFDINQVYNYSEHFDKTREIIQELLQLFENYKISATWAVVGHLFLESCNQQGRIPHPDLVRPDHEWFQDDWFSEDPCTNLDEDPYWYGRDIVRYILDCDIDQELASHSFSHVIFGDNGCSEETAQTEIEKCQELAEQIGVKLSSFVFPRNSVGQLDILAKKGFCCYRGKNNRWYEKEKRIPDLVSKPLRFLEEALSLVPPTSTPRRKSDLLEIPGSMQYRPVEHLWRFIPIRNRVKRAKKGLETAANRNEIFHLWFHPFNLGKGTEKLLSGLEDILDYSRSLEQEDRIEILPMKEFRGIAFE